MGREAWTGKREMSGKERSRGMGKSPSSSRGSVEFAGSSDISAYIYKD